MTYDLQTFASVPLAMEPAAARAWMARHAGGPNVTRAWVLADYEAPGDVPLAGRIDLPDSVAQGQ